jgi:hypothetical protein
MYCALVSKASAHRSQVGIPDRREQVITKAQMARFWQRVDRNGPVPPHAPHLGGCWIWTGEKSVPGYGYLSSGRKSKKVIASRLSFAIHCGRWPEPCCLHRCDNPSCVNPAHLFEGTIADNNRDMWSKGRGTNSPRKGEDHHKAKLTEEAVMEIRATPARTRELAVRFGVSVSTIKRARNGQRWRHVCSSRRPPSRSPERLGG